jgi:adenylosuccinate synthase
LIVDERADVITKIHIELDQANSKGAIGTTGKGIGPCHEDSVGRRGIRMIDYAKEHPEFKRFLGNVSLLVNDYLDKGKNVLMEGAQGTHLSIKWGTYPYVTSSEPIAGGACTGLGIGPKRIDKVIGVAKAFVSRVGNGPFPTELGGKMSEEYCKDKTHEKLFELKTYGIPYEIIDDEEKKIKYDHFSKKILYMMNSDDDFIKGVGLRLAGDEYGTTTQRPRRTGWFDVVAAKHSCRVNGVDEIALTKLDVLDFMDRLKISNYYEIGGGTTDVFPADEEQLENCKPIYAINAGWKERTSGVRLNQDLPHEAGAYIDLIEHLLKTPITMIGVGPEREQLIIVKK